MNSPAHPDLSRKAKRRLLSLLVLAAVVGLGLVALFALLLRQSEQTTGEGELHPTVVQAPTNLVATPSQPALAASPLPATPAPAASDVVAIVNSKTITVSALRIITGVDRAMADLLAQPLPSEDAIDRLVNDELVLQAAAAAGFSIPETEIQQALVAFLRERGLDESALAKALRTQGVSIADFRTYFGQLLLIDRFARQEAAAQGISLSDYIAYLQQQAHISYGDASEIVAATPQIIATPTSLPALATPLASLPKEDAEAMMEQLARGGDGKATPADVQAEQRGLAVGQLAPDFSLPLLGSEGAEFYSWSDLLGQPTVLSFWTTWCPYCRRQTPNLVAGYQEWAAQGVQFVGIDVKEERAVVAAYAAQNHISYPIVLDHDGAVAERYGVRGFPITYFLDAEGRVLARQIGVITKEKIDQWIKSHEDAS